MPLECETVVGGQLVVLRSQLKKRTLEQSNTGRNWGSCALRVWDWNRRRLKLKKTPNPKSQTKGPGLAHICAFENKTACVWWVETKKNDYLQSAGVTICNDFFKSHCRNIKLLSPIQFNTEIVWAAVTPTTRPLPQILHLHLKRFAVGEISIFQQEQILLSVSTGGPDVVCVTEWIY